MIRLNETNPRLDRRNTFVDESHSGHVANYLVHDLVVPARRRETEGLPPPLPRCSGRSPIDSSPRSEGSAFHSNPRFGEELCGRRQVKAPVVRLSFPFTIRLSSKLARFKVDHDTIDLLTRHATMAKEHRIVVNTIRISLTPRGEGREEGGGGRFPFWKYASIVLQSAYLRHPRGDIT